MFTYVMFKLNNLGITEFSCRFHNNNTFKPKSEDFSHLAKVSNNDILHLCCYVWWKLKLNLINNFLSVLCKLVKMITQYGFIETIL